MENLTTEKLSNVAYIDDDRLHLEALVEKFKKKGLAVQTFLDGREALSFISKNPKQFKIVIVDYILQGVRGDQVVRAIKDINPSIHTVILSSELNQNMIKSCRMGGADQIFDKRSTSDVLLRLSDVAKLQVTTTPQTKLMMSKNADIIQSILGLKGRSSGLSNVAKQVKIYSQAKENILIIGKSGVGKEQVAHAIHKNSQRKAQPFLALNCGAIPNELIQSVLFGHKKGAFSGAVSDKKGHFEAAHGGTIFLDEIGEMPLHHQVSLLRVLQEKTITRVGENQPIKINVRVIAATNRDLPELIRKGGFREDLYYRLNVLPISIPLLVERKEDIAPIANFIINLKNQDTGEDKKISHEGIKYLESQVWKGNIRELESVIKRAYAGAGDTIKVDHLCLNHESVISPLDFERLPTFKNFPTWREIREEFETYEKKYLQKTLGLAKGNKTQAAKIAGIPYTSYMSRRQKFKLDFHINT